MRFLVYFLCGCLLFAEGQGEGRKDSQTIHYDESPLAESRRTG
jgi:hypothetical protein